MEAGQNFSKNVRNDTPSVEQLERLVSILLGPTDDKESEDLGNTVLTVEKLGKYIFDRLTVDKLDKESTPIVDALRDINKMGFISFESQLAKTTSHWKNRAYINGIYPKRLLPKFLQLLPKGIVVSETQFDSKSGDKLFLHGRTDFTTPLVWDLYPMSLNGRNNKSIWVEGYSGNVVHPSSREYINDHFFPFNNKLVSEIECNYSLLQIWSENIDDPLFPTLLGALSKVK